METTAAISLAHFNKSTTLPSARPSLERSHPLDDLSADEVKRCATLCKSYAASTSAGEIRFNSIQLQEPLKAELLLFQSGQGAKPLRQALCVVILPKTNQVAEAIIHLDSGTLASWKVLEGVHPMTTPDDNCLAEEIMKQDAALRSLLKERYGIEDMSKIACDTWACHNAPPHLNHRRLMQGFLYARHCPGDNEYAHPIDLSPIVDLNERCVVHIDMMKGQVPKVPAACSNYHRDLQDKPFRGDIKPLHIVQPQGPSFSVEGNLVKWQNWNIRVGFNPREGLVLHQVGYEDGGRVRPVLHRMSLVEMAVPYGDPNYIQARKSAFDVGDYGFGFSANSLSLGCDCLGHIKYFDGVVNDSQGQPVIIKNAICLHEEDAGILWKHYDCRSGHTEVRRARKLVLQQISTFMNYEYIMSYNFFQDGSIHFEVKLSGILSTSIAPVGEDRPSFGVRVAPGVNATVHQHFFCMRIDPAVDDPHGGRDVVVSEVEARSLPAGPENPFLNAFVMHETDLTNTDMARRDVNFSTARHWRMKNPAVLNPISSEPVAYKLLPGPTPGMMMMPGSLVHRRAHFATRNLWVTPYADDQKYPAGDHVVQSQKCMGLAEWTKQNTPLDGADPVVWFSFGVTHAPRVEDFPVMPVEVLGFMLKPDGFFSGNPAVDLPPDRNKLSVEYDSMAKQQGQAAACCAMPMSKL
mmetsp:Transcript_39335/g.87541  ORF Transcript_39335/g.87541 Transcript_39335/m.87541 type:complete len:691 (-) Transcript_39335:902-2974(-)